MGTYHHVSAKYLPFYLAEFQFRHNNRSNRRCIWKRSPMLLKHTKTGAMLVASPSKPANQRGNYRRINHRVSLIVRMIEATQAMPTARKSSL